jgi:hypothetical protein
MVNSEVTRPSISLLRSAPAPRFGTLEAERALALSPNLAAGYWQRGNTLLFAGQPEKGLADLRTSLRLDPRGSNLTLRAGAAKSPSIGGASTRRPERKDERTCYL